MSIPISLRVAFPFFDVAAILTLWFSLQVVWSVELSNGSVGGQVFTFGRWLLHEDGV
jgi:hypothetical protein